MDKKTLLSFVHRILSSSSQRKAEISLAQLKELLTAQNAPQSDIALIENMCLSVPELQQTAKEWKLTDNAVATALRRAEERRRREEMMRRQGRC